MGKKIKAKNLRTGKIEYFDEDDLGKTFTQEDYIKCGYFGREEQYKYFCEHPDEVYDEKLFSELKEEFGEDDNT